jgi:hypothetical protein
MKIFKKKLFKDSLWTPSRNCELTSPGSLAEPSPGGAAPRMSLESPPETAIEATPETTPFVTPVKDDTFRFVRPQPSNIVSRALNLDCKSLQSPATVSMCSAMLSPTSSKEPSPFRFPEPHPTGPHHHGNLFLIKYYI